MSEPVRCDTMHYHKDTNPQNLHFPFAYFHDTSLSFLGRKEKPHKDFSDLLEDQILQPLRKVIEYKNLVSQLSTIQPQQQQRIIPGGDGILYPNMPSMTLTRMNLTIICLKSLALLMRMILR